MSRLFNTTAYAIIAISSLVALGHYSRFCASLKQPTLSKQVQDAIQSNSAQSTTQSNRIQDAIQSIAVRQSLASLFGSGLNSGMTCKGEPAASIAFDVLSVLLALAMFGMWFLATELAEKFNTFLVILLFLFVIIATGTGAGASSVAGNLITISNFTALITCTVLVVYALNGGVGASSDKMTGTSHATYSQPPTQADLNA